MLGRLLRSILVGLTVGGLLLALMPSLHQWQLTPTTQNDTADNSLVSYNAVVRRAAPAMVNVYNRVLNNTSHDQLTLGSGVIMDQRGYILTNKCVINDIDQVIATLQGGRAFEASLIGSDTLIDLVMLKINTTGGLPVVPINPKRMPHIGDVVLVVGDPYNLGQTITQEIINVTGCTGPNPTGRQSFSQTSASINHGSSGGTLMNSLGKLIRTNILSFDGSNDGETPEGIGFAIPFQLATEIMDKLIRDSRVIHGYIGINGQEIAPLHTQGGGVDQIQGIVVNDVALDGPAAQAEIRVNDVITSVNDKPAVSTLETMNQVAEIHPGSETPVVIMRDDRKITPHIAIQECPATN